MSDNAIHYRPVREADLEALRQLFTEQAWEFRVADRERSRLIPERVRREG